MILTPTKEYLLLLDEEAKIKEEHYAYCSWSKSVYKVKIVTPTSYIDEEGFAHRKKKAPFLVANVIGYFPWREESKELDLYRIPNPFEGDVPDYLNPHFKDVWKEGYKAAQSKQFSLDDMKKAIELAQRGDNIIFGNENKYQWVFNYGEEQILELLSTQNYPTEFIPQYNICETYLDDACNVIISCCNTPNRFMAIINKEGKPEILGTYKY